MTAEMMKLDGIASGGGMADLTWSRQPRSGYHASSYMFTDDPLNTVPLLIPYCARLSAARQYEGNEAIKTERFDGAKEREQMLKFRARGSVVDLATFTPLLGHDWVV